MPKQSYRRVGNRLVKVEAGRTEDDFERNYAIGLGIVLSILTTSLLVFGGGALIMGMHAFGEAVGFGSMDAIGYWGAVFRAIVILLVVVAVRGIVRLVRR